MKPLLVRSNIRMYDTFTRNSGHQKVWNFYLWLVMPKVTKPFMTSEDIKNLIPVRNYINSYETSVIKRVDFLRVFVQESCNKVYCFRIRPHTYSSLWIYNFVNTFFILLKLRNLILVQKFTNKIIIRENLLGLSRLTKFKKSIHSW